MQPNKAGLIIILTILGLIFIMLSSIVAQKAIRPHPIKGWHNMNIDSMVTVTVKKNSQFIEKRVGELKHRAFHHHSQTQQFSYLLIFYLNHTPKQLP